MEKNFKKAVAALTLALTVGGVQAQTAKVEYTYNGMYQFIPKSMTADGKVRLVTKSSEGSNGTAKVNITVYGSDFEQEKVITNSARITSTGNTRTRRATSATISECDSTDITSDIEYYATPDDMDGSVTVDDYMNYCNRTGDGVNITADGYYYSNYCWRFYGEEVFGQRYPYYFVKIEGGKAYRVDVEKYTPDFTDAQWTSDSWTDYEYADEMVWSFTLHDLDDEKGYSQSEPLILTQSLFNDDDKFEYIRTLRKAGATGGGGDWNTSVVYPSTDEQDPIETETLDQTTYGVCGYEVVSEDGNVVFTIEIDDEDVAYSTYYEDIMVVKMNGELYFIVTTKSYSSDESNKLLVYKLDKTTNSVKKIETSNAIRISPRIVSESQPVSITFKEATNAEACVVVTSLDGRTVAKRRIGAGETSVDISTAGMAAGLYNFTVYSKGRVAENGKVIVK